MNEKRGNIETWLKTAAQQPGPGSDQQDEDAGWAGLAAMLEEDEDKSPGIISRWQRGKRWLTLAAIALAVSVLLLIFLPHPNDVSQPPRTMVITDKTNNNTGNSTGPHVSGKPVENNGVTGKTNDNNESNRDNPQMAFSSFSKPLQNTGNVVNNDAGNTAVSTTDDITGEIKQPSTLNVLPRANNNMMSAHLFLKTIPLRENGHDLTFSGVHKLPIVPLQDSSTHRDPRWVLQAGFLAASDKGLGGRLSIMYRMPVGRRFYLQPYIGIGYTGSYNKRLQHLGVFSTEIGNTGQYRTDSTWTIYSVKRMINADAGVRIGYSLRQFSFGAGIRYQHILQSGGDSASYQKPAPAAASGIYGQTFSKGDAPGRHSFYGEAEAAYQWRPGLQVGISYQLLIHTNTSPAWQPPLFDINSSTGSVIGQYTLPRAANKSLQDKGRLEIYLRIPLEKK